jgi:hypothetical protein
MLTPSLRKLLAAAPVILKICLDAFVCLGMPEALTRGLLEEGVQEEVSLPADRDTFRLLRHGDSL